MKVKLLEKLENIKAKIKKQKINTIAGVKECSRLFDRYSELNKMIFKK